MKKKRIPIVRRDLPEAEAVGENSLAETTVNRRIMVTVERETVTVLVRGQPQEDAQKSASEKAGLEAQYLGLPPPAPALEGRDRP